MCPRASWQLSSRSCSGSCRRGSGRRSLAQAPGTQAVPGELDDPVGAGGELRVVRDEQGRSAGREPLERGADQARGLGVEVRRGLVEDEQGCVAKKRPRECDALRLAGREAPAPSPIRVAAPSGSESTTGSSAAAEIAAHTAASGASGAPSRTFSSSVAAKIVGRCGTQARRRRQATGSTSRRSIPSQRTAPDSGSSSRSTSAASVVLPSPLAPTSATRSPGSRRSETPRAPDGRGPGRRPSRRRARPPRPRDPEPAAVARGRARRPARRARPGSARRRRGRRRRRGSWLRAGGSAGTAREPGSGRRGRSADSGDPRRAGCRPSPRQAPCRASRTARARAR